MRPLTLIAFSKASPLSGFAEGRPCGTLSEGCAFFVAGRIHLPVSLCSTGVTPLHRSYGHADSCPEALWRRLVTDARTPSLTEIGLFASCKGTSDHSASNHLMCRDVALTRYPSARRAPRGSRLAWTIRVRASPYVSGLANHIRPNRVHLRCGLAVHLQLLSTSPRGDAVTFSYGPESAYPKRTCTSLIPYTHERTDTAILGFQRWKPMSRMSRQRVTREPILNRMTQNSFEF